jgi:hypothetical protein
MKKINLNNFKSSLALKVIALLVVAAIFTGGGYYVAMRNADTSGDTQKELEQVIKKISKLMILPEDEVPTLATVTDPKKLEGQPFFAKAQAGDKILIYSNIKKVILYSPSINKIIEVGGINLNN